jgi:hypothetical protein
MKIITTLPAGAPLIDRVVDVIEHNPDAHDQGEWIAREGFEEDGTPAPEVIVSADNFPCGTTACVAGWAVLLSGHSIRMPEGSNYAHGISDNRAIAIVAERLLKLTPDEAETLFYCAADLGEIRDAVAAIKTARI